MNPEEAIADNDPEMLPPPDPEIAIDRRMIQVTQKNVAELDQLLADSVDLLDESTKLLRLGTH